MSPLITGSLAFDYIMETPDKFADNLPATLTPAFSAAFIAPSMRRAFGGCAGNIAYGLRQLGDSPVLMATVGDDFAPYDDYLREMKINREQIKPLRGHFTAQAYIITDRENSQLIFFHSGAAAFAQRQKIADIKTPPLAIVAPNGREGMLQHARDLAQKKIPFIFDPGQAMSLFSGAELKEMMKICTYAIFNRDEFSAMQKNTGLKREVGGGRLQALIITRGKQGSVVVTADGEYKTAAAVFGDIVDPTGCGDAYRAGLIYGLLRKWRWRQIIAFAAVVAGKKILHNGGQGYSISRQEARRLYQQHTGEAAPS